MARRSSCRSTSSASGTRTKWTPRVSTKRDRLLLDLLTEIRTRLPPVAEIDAQVQQSGQRPEVPVRRIEGLHLPYLMVTMDSGTVCDLNGQPRLTRVFYVCYAAGKHEIFSLEEASTCEYEIVILTPYLCQHPDFR